VQADLGRNVDIRLLRSLMAREPSRGAAMLSLGTNSRRSTRLMLDGPKDSQEISGPFEGLKNLRHTIGHARVADECGSRMSWHGVYAS
jgi:hypothetical protein